MRRTTVVQCIQIITDRSGFEKQVKMKSLGTCRSLIIWNKSNVIINGYLEDLHLLKSADLFIAEPDQYNPNLTARRILRPRAIDVQNRSVLCHSQLIQKNSSIKEIIELYEDSNDNT